MKQWVKLWTELLHDRKMHMLTDRQFRVCINLFAIAGIVDDDGKLMSLDDMAFQLRTDPGDLQGDLEALRAVNITDLQNGEWRLVHYVKRQPTIPSAEPKAVAARVRKHRAKAKAAAVTTCNELPKDVTTVTTIEESRVEESRVEERDSVVQPRRKRLPASPVPPAVEAFRRGAGLYPPKPCFRDIVEAVGDDNSHLQLWEHCCHEWVKRGYKPTNVSGMLEWFQAGGPPGAGARASPTQAQLATRNADGTFNMPPSNRFQPSQ